MCWFAPAPGFSPLQDAEARAQAAVNEEQLAALQRGKEAAEEQLANLRQVKQEVEQKLAAAAAEADERLAAASAEAEKKLAAALAEAEQARAELAQAKEQLAEVQRSKDAAEGERAIVPGFEVFLYRFPSVWKARAGLPQCSVCCSSTARQMLLQFA